MESSDDLLSFKPLFFLATRKNPFRLPSRIYPISYAYPINEKNIIKFKIPEGYAVEELPEKLVISLPESAGKYSYSIKAVNDFLLISTSFKLNKLLFSPEEYVQIKTFYDAVIEKETEQVVLKKKS